jgi:hypothetical protein
MNVVISATTQRGAGVASKNIKFQMPHLIWQLPELKNIHTATINILLDRPLLISRLDRTTLPIPWWDVDNSSPQGRWHIERFSILPVLFEHPINAPTKEAWLFVSHDSAYFKAARTPLVGFCFKAIEVVTQKIDGLATGQRCKIHVEKTDNVDVG